MRVVCVCRCNVVRAKVKLIGSRNLLFSMPGSNNEGATDGVADHHLESERRSSRCSSRKTTLFLAAAASTSIIITAAVLYVVSTADSKSINVRSKQVAAVAAPIDDYKFVGAGNCQPEKGKFYPSVGATTPCYTPEECAAACECARGINGVTLRGFTSVIFDPTVYSIPNCSCNVDWLGNNPNQFVIDALNAACAAAPFASDDYNGNCEIFNGRGKIKGTDGNIKVLCYQFKGNKDTKAAKISKCGKTEASLQPSTAPSFAPSDE